MKDSLSAAQLLRVLRAQHKEAKKRKETVPLRDWCAQLQLSAVISKGNYTTDGFYSSEVIKEALETFHKETGGRYE